MESVLVLGGGVSGVRVAMGLRDRYKVTMVSNRRGFQPHCLNFEILYGSAGHKDKYLDISCLEGIDFKDGEVLVLDPDGMKAITNIGEYAADYIVVALGTKEEVSAIKWFTKVGYNLTDPFETYLAFKAVRAISKGKVAILAPPTTYSCPTLAHSAALIVDWLLRKFGKREKFELTLYSGKYERGFEPVYEALEGLMEGRGIKVVKGLKIRGVDDSRKELIFEEGRERFDLLLGIPPQKCPVPVSKSGLEMRNGWLKVDESFRTSNPSIFGVGDVASVLVGGREAPKLGVFAELEAEALVKVMLGEEAGLGGEASYVVPTGDAGMLVHIDLGNGKVWFEGPKKSILDRLKESCTMPSARSRQ